MRFPRPELAADLFTALVVGSVGVALAGLTWRLMGDSGIDVHKVPLRSIGQPASTVDIAPIIAAAPFGNSVAPTQTAGGDLQLRAILFADPRAASSVMVSLNGGPAQSFLIGATLPNGAVLDGVELDHAVVRTASGRQTLAFPQAPGAAGSPSGGAATGGDVAAIRALIPAQAQGLPAPSPGILSPPPQSGSQPLLDSLGATATGAGYRVGPGLSPQLRAAGLQPGDMIDRINGNAVGNPQSDRDLLNSAMTSGSAQIELVRDGKRITLSFPVR